MLHFRAILLLSLLLTSCEGEHYNAPVDQPLFFEYHYINFAWAHQDFGWLIDNEGSIRRFDFPVDYRHGVHGEYLSLEDLEYNLDQTDSIIGTVEAGGMEKYIDYIPGAARGELEESRSVGADMGGATLACYRYDPAEDAYQYVLLELKGDWEQLNLSSEAETLVKWLSGLCPDYLY